MSAIPTPDSLSAFLRSPEWQAHQRAETNSVENYQGSLYLQRPLPFRGTYWLSTRCTIEKSWSIPSFSRSGWFLRLQADSEASYQNILKNVDNFSTSEGPAIQPQQTLVLDLQQSEANLLAAMKAKHRYNIKVATRNEVEIEEHRENLAELLPRFWNLLNETAERHTFRTHQEAHYRSIISHLEPAQMVRLIFATHKGKDVAAIMLITCGTVATYLHGGSSYSNRSLMAPYLLHWQTMQQLKKDGFITYDLWGTNAVQNEKGEWEPISNHPSAGTTRFKLGFGGTIVSYPPTLDIIFQPFWYSVYRTITRLRGGKRAFS